MALSSGGNGSAIVLVLFLLRGLGGVVASPFLPAFARVVDLGEVTFDEATIGTQKSEIRVEVKSSTGEPITLDLNYLRLVPSSVGWGQARGLANNQRIKVSHYGPEIARADVLAEYGRFDPSLNFSRSYGEAEAAGTLFAPGARPLAQIDPAHRHARRG